MKRIFLGALAVCLAALTACAHADGDALRATFFAAGAAGETAAFAAGPDGMPQIMLRYSSAVTRAGGGFCGRSSFFTAQA